MVECEGKHPSVCRRCGVPEPYILLDKVHVECKTCFIDSCNKKLRLTVGRSKLVRNNEPILIACSGGPSSCALLDMIKFRVDSDNRLEQRFRPSILHIDMQSIHPERSHSAHEMKSDRISQLNNLLSQLKNTYPEWAIYWTTFEICIGDNASNGKCYGKFETIEDIHKMESHLLSNDDAYNRLQDSLNELTDLTERQQFVADKLNELMDRVAFEINSNIDAPGDQFKFLFVGSSATQLANKLMVDVILGRGCSIRNTVNVCDKRPPVPILRPMRDFSKKEVAFYLRAKSIEPCVQPNLMTKAGCKSSIFNLTETFLGKLNNDYSDTYSTLLRTGNKLHE